ncbi:hypothetical protein FBU30_004577 [Linnemannia zychae]|nr:hypothetical protein FBU30_004577 [Linnemannia zychae]
MSILLVPELVAQIASYLDIGDLNACVRIRKFWHATFGPHLWHTLLPPITTQNFKTLPMAQTNFRQLIIDDLRSARKQQLYEREEKLAGDLPNLDDIDIEYSNYNMEPIMDQHVARLLSVNQKGVCSIMAKDFVDADPKTKTLRPWACESTLTVFSAKIIGIPRPDVTMTHYGRPHIVLQETYPGESYAIQRQVYERLSRFTHLKILSLGNDDCDLGNQGRFVENELEDRIDEYIYGDDEFQYECLSMNLYSGVEILGALKKLRVLNIFRMATMIDVKDIEWMVKAWPRLELVSGLNTETYEADAHKWLIELQSRKIQSTPCVYQTAPATL